MTTLTATYSPDDNKLRLYASSRLDAETYSRVKAAGFRWAPKQELFYAPAWSPRAEDLLIELAGEIEDEDGSLVDRAEQRAERFEQYSDNRAADAARAREAVSAIADNIPLGQPILVGHHSEKRARKDAERIESGMRRAVKMWDTAQYWQRRAAGAIRAAKYKERPDVRARRIKKIEADQRKAQKESDEAAKLVKAWNAPAELSMAWALKVSGASYLSRCFPLADFPRDPPASQYEGPMGIYSALDGGIITPEQAREMSVRAHERTIASRARWLAHYANRLEYERAMLAESGGLETDKTKPEKGGAVRSIWSPRGCAWAYIVKVNRVSVTIRHTWNPGSGRTFTKTLPFDDCAAVMSAADVEAAREAGRLVEDVDACGFALLETAPTPEDVAKFEDKAATVASDDRAVFESMRDQLRAGIQVTAANQLFPTPRDLAERMAKLADIEPGHSVLEPSAGTGMLIGAMGGRMFLYSGERLDERHGTVTAVEINSKLCERLRRDFPLTTVHCADFLELIPSDFGTFDRIVMNPPFSDGADIRHIQRAAAMLKPGGRLVALCANGPRQQAALIPMADSFEQLPAGSFKEAGTNVSVALLVITKEE